MSMSDQNPRAVAGDNSASAPDYAAMQTADLRRDYESIENTVAELLESARPLPAVVDDDDQMGIFARLIKRFRDVNAQIDAYRVKEKEPHLRRGNAVDQFFNRLAEKVMRQKKTDKPGAADILQARVDDYMQRKLAAEQAKRKAEAEAAARVAREAEQKAAADARAAAEAQAAAERARAPVHVAAKASVAEAAHAKVTDSKIEEKLSAGKAEEAHVRTLAKPADIARTRVDDALVTMKTEAYAEIEDSAALDKEKLWPFISEAEKAKALRQWAKTTGHNMKMAGAAIGKRSVTAVR